MDKPEMIEALTERGGLSEAEAEQAAKVIDEVLTDQESEPPRGELFQDAIVNENTGLLTLSSRLKRLRGRRRA